MNICMSIRIVFDKELSQPKQTAIKRLIASVMQQLSIENKLSSANVNFMLKEEIDPFLTCGYMLRETIQYRWTNRDKSTGQSFVDFDDFLTGFKSKRRVQIKRERTIVYNEELIEVRAIRGDSVEATVSFYQTMYELYTTTVEKMWGTMYLSSDFFTLLATAPPEFRKHLVFIVAYKGGKIIAGTINLVKGNKFYGRYWGAFSFVRNLHFEVCYYRAIEFCIENGIEYMEPGAGGGEFKFLRGFDPYIVNSVHYITNPVLREAVRNFLESERQKNAEIESYLLQNSKGKRLIAF